MTTPRSGPDDNITIELSEDRRTLKVFTPTDRGVETATQTFIEPATPEEVYRAVGSIANFSGHLTPGEKTVAWRKLGFIVILNTGPPTWRLPRLRVRFGRDWFVHAGWLRAALSISHTRA